MTEGHRIAVRCVGGCGGKGRMMENPDLFVDISEPQDIFGLLVKSVPAKMTHMNILGYADYTWVDVNNQMVSVERKQWPELLSDVDSVEYQLRRYMPNTVDLHLLVEGVAEPTAYGIETYHRKRGKQVYTHNWSFGVQGRAQPGAYAKVMAWFWQLDKCGITVHQTANMEASAAAIAAWYKNSQKEEHTTLNRYYKDRIELQVHNPQVRTLMGIDGAGIGETKAKQLIEEFGSVWGVMTAELEDVSGLPGWGEVTARKLFKAVGRPDVAW